MMVSLVQRDSQQPTPIRLALHRVGSRVPIIEIAN
jgi:hypothetical protein